MSRLQKGLLLFAIFFVVFFLFGLLKPLPSGVSIASDYYTLENTSVQFLGDLTYTQNNSRIYNQTIFPQIYDAIDDASEFILIDMFLFTNEPYENTDLIPLAQDLTDKLVAKKKMFPDLEIIFITDHLITFYGSHKPLHIEQLENANISVIYSNTNKLRNSNPLYNTLWDMSLRFFGLPKYNGKTIPNFMTSSPEKMGFRSALRLLNFKANHRKVFVSDKDSFVISANPHIGSSLHSNVGLRVQDYRIANKLIESEQAVLQLSGSDITLDQLPMTSIELNNTVDVAILTEKKIRDEVISQINSAESNSKIKIAMFYFSDRKIVKALKKAIKRDVSVELLLDANKDAFGNEKNGIPNRQVAWELQKYGASIRWYNTQGEQFHTKLFIKIDDDIVTLIIGSANYTKRNIGNYNLETNLIFVGKKSDEVSKDALNYWDSAWSEEKSLDFESFKDTSWFKYWLYRFQEWTGLSSF